MKKINISGKIDKIFSGTKIEIQPVLNFYFMNRILSKILLIIIIIGIIVIYETLVNKKVDNQKISLGPDGLLYIAGTDELYSGLFKDTANVIIEFTVINGIKYGSFKTYFLNGQLEKEGLMKNNKNVGEWKYYFENGQLETIGSYYENIPYGQWKSYYINGNIKSIGSYRFGKQQGAWEYYDLNGNLINIIYFDDGKYVGLEINRS